MSILTLTDGAFDETINGSDTPVLVDFWAEWCGPCKMIAPVLEEIAREQAARSPSASSTSTTIPSTARRYEVMSIPTLMVFNNGSLEKRARRGQGQGPASRRARRIRRLSHVHAR